MLQNKGLVRRFIEILNNRKDISLHAGDHKSLHADDSGLLVAAALRACKLRNVPRVGEKIQGYAIKTGKDQFIESEIDDMRENRNWIIQLKRFKEILKNTGDISLNANDSGFLVAAALRACTSCNVWWVGEKIQGYAIKTGKDVEFEIDNMHANWNWIFLTKALNEYAYYYITIQGSSAFDKQDTRIRSIKSIHAYALRNFYEDEMMYFSSHLIKAYSKLGNLSLPRAMFDNMAQKDVGSWRSLMIAYQENRCDETVKIFEEFIKHGFHANESIFTILLDSIAKCGQLEEGLSYLLRMHEHFGVEPALQHYSCIVNMFGTAGYINQALEIIDKMPMEPNDIIWRTILDSCVVHDYNIEAAMDVLKKRKMSDMAYEHMDKGTRQILDKIHAGQGNWDESYKIRVTYEIEKKRPGGVARDSS